MDPILNQFWWDGNTGIPHEFPGEILVASGFLVRDSHIRNVAHPFFRKWLML